MSEKGYISQVCVIEADMNWKILENNHEKISWIVLVDSYDLWK